MALSSSCSAGKPFWPMIVWRVEGNNGERMRERVWLQSSEHKQREPESAASRSLLWWPCRKPGCGKENGRECARFWMARRGMGVITQVRVLRHLGGVPPHPCSPKALAKSGRLAGAPTELGAHFRRLLMPRGFHEHLISYLSSLKLSGCSNFLDQCPCAVTGITK